MILNIGTTYSFTFVTDFQSLDGIYRVRAETTFSDCISSGVDFVSNLYVPAGRTSDDFKNEFVNYKNDKVAVLELVANSSVIYYVPESIFLNIPDPTVREYYNLNLLVKLGAFERVESILPFVESVQDLLSSELGVTDTIKVITNSKRKIYLTQAEYQNLVNERDQNINRATSLRVQLVNKEKEIAYLRSLVSSYEALIKQTV